ncbi:hypothetical protein Poli38472_000377 [Pythium oligandrum]|uniref:Uncharacterized protein n=1 Tax=Pythium oligandrum TaxID=41045 RepID=A0A8K1CCK8_PYTOL|nr:hypothetical protein Poli38472_000377 [Pythium oligandrum]|eukprot:TMW60335.1 hypothetical protein Poli38472_000377 [Pythium oligandrum]
MWTPLSQPPGRKWRICSMEATETMDMTPEETEETEYGLKDLAQLPLLEQVHRLFHAIQQKYPYTETTAWKTMPLEQKKRMLEYIRERRAKRGDQPMQSTSVEVSVEAQTENATTESATTPEPSSAVKTDPYLQMLQKRSLRITTVEGNATHPNSSYVSDQQQAAVYVENPSRRQFKARWKVVDAEFYENTECKCGKTHEDPLAGGSAGGSGTKAAATSLLATMSAMMTTFGDTSRPCETAVKQVKTAVGAYLRECLAPLMDDGEVNAPCLRTLVEIFAEEAAYYGRWREFRGETKPQEQDLEEVEEEELAEELDLFAVSEADAVFNESFLERIRFADERTQAMDWSIYDLFAKSRKLNFMSHKGAPFRQWLKLGTCSRASLEFMNFVTYHNIGRLVEMAIKQRTGGSLQVLESPLMKEDIVAVNEQFMTEARQRPSSPDDLTEETPSDGPEKNEDSVLSLLPPPAKTRRLDDATSTRSAPSIATSTGSKATSSAAAAPRAPPQRLTRLKRLR